MDLVQFQFGGCCSWILFGALAGWIASLITRRNRQGCITNIVVGIVGAFIGGAIFGVLSGGEFTVRWSLSALIVSVLGAVLLLVIVDFFTRRR